jgi:hypothetical protein
MATKGRIVILCLVCKVYFDKFSDEVLGDFTPTEDDSILGGYCASCRDLDESNEKAFRLSRSFAMPVSLSSGSGS